MSQFFMNKQVFCPNFGILFIIQSTGKVRVQVSEGVTWNTRSLLFDNIKTVKGLVLLHGSTEM